MLPGSRRVALMLDLQGPFQRHSEVYGTIPRFVGEPRVPLSRNSRVIFLRGATDRLQPVLFVSGRA